MELKILSSRIIVFRYVLEHRERIEKIADILKADQFSVATSYHQIEIGKFNQRPYH